ncbi:hypothetical protein B7C42_08127 [Nocardia cerradoensis]|uniref:Uncharacterized protein n=1 Tax=Nocardia cerradoensis TaxID=85688 RepID=A0A231GT94_9NOCA|nr:hypothetical protein B7C42_08127 [Nocardia cerradoensis]
MPSSLLILAWGRRVSQTKVRSTVFQALVHFRWYDVTV